jgi:hypothetical protein
MFSEILRPERKAVWSASMSEWMAAFMMQFCREIGQKSVGVLAASDFGKEHQKGTVDAGEVNGVIIEGAEDREHVRGHSVPEAVEEGGVETIRPRTGQLVHVNKSLSDLVMSKGAVKLGESRGALGYRDSRLNRQVVGATVPSMPVKKLLRIVAFAAWEVIKEPCTTRAAIELRRSQEVAEA